MNRLEWSRLTSQYRCGWMRSYSWIRRWGQQWWSKGRFAGVRWCRGCSSLSSKFATFFKRKGRSSSWFWCCGRCRWLVRWPTWCFWVWSLGIGVVYRHRIQFWCCWCSFWMRICAVICRGWFLPNCLWDCWVDPQCRWIGFAGRHSWVLGFFLHLGRRFRWRHFHFRWSWLVGSCQQGIVLRLILCRYRQQQLYSTSSVIFFHPFWFAFWVRNSSGGLICSAGSLSSLYVNQLVPYRSMDMPSTTMRGAQAVSGPSGLISGMDCRMPIIRK